MAGMMRNLENCAPSLLSWNKKSRVQMFGEIKRLRTVLAEVNSDPRSPWQWIRAAKRSLDSVLQMEEKFWQQRSRTAWLRNRDRNIKYFHAKATGRQTKNKIEVLLDDNDFGGRKKRNHVLSLMNFSLLCFVIMLLGKLSLIEFFLVRINGYRRLRFST
ncbi:hypothetical protein ACOSQ4_013091 [Xanthoceras sorbifolium]